MKPRPVGFHVSIAGGLDRAVDRALELGCDALQIFPSNPRGWALPVPKASEEARLREAIETNDFPLFLHTPYVVNFASPVRETVERSFRTASFAMERGARVGASGVVVHAGNAKEGDPDEAFEQAAAALGVLTEHHDGPDVLIELTAGGHGAVAFRVEHVKALIAAAGGNTRLRLCLDTCHLWASGADWPSAAGMDELAAQLRELGPERLGLVHLNDSRDTLGSRRDRHANLGDGTIGTEPFERLLALPELAGVPVVMETPGTIDRQREDVAFVRSLH